MSSSAASDLVKDLLKPNPIIYWADLLATALIGWAAFAVAAIVPLSTAGVLGAALAAAALYRGLCFLHEISHRSPGALPGFETAWSLLFGYPLLLPSFVYSDVHRNHHKLTTYGTALDPEYLPFARNSAMTFVFALQSFFIPIALVVRFLPLSVIGLIAPPFQRWLVIHASSLTMNLVWRRDATRDLIRTVRIHSAFLLLFWIVLAAILPLRFFLVWLAVSSAVSFVNTLRTLGAHAYESTGEPMDREAQLLDSIDTPGAFWTELWAPAGLRYHALHHYLPGIPYHNLPRAWRRLSSRLPLDAPYHRVQSPGLAHSLRALWLKARRCTSES